MWCLGTNLVPKQLAIASSGPCENDNDSRVLCSEPGKVLYKNLNLGQSGAIAKNKAHKNHNADVFIARRI